MKKSIRRMGDYLMDRRAKRAARVLPYEKTEQPVLSMLIVDDIFIENLLLKEYHDQKKEEDPSYDASKNKNFFSEELCSGLEEIGFKRAEIDGESKDIYGKKGKDNFVRLIVYEKQENDALLRIIMTSHPEVARRVVEKCDPEDEELFDILPRNGVLFQPYLVGAYIDHYFPRPSDIYNNIYHPETTIHHRLGEAARRGDWKRVDQLTEAAKKVQDSTGRLAREIAMKACLRNECKVYSLSEAGMIKRMVEEGVMKRVYDDYLPQLSESELKKFRADLTKELGEKIEQIKMGNNTSTDIDVRKNAPERVKEIKSLFEDSLGDLRNSKRLDPYGPSKYFYSRDKGVWSKLTP